MKYLYILTFLFTHDIKQLKEYWLSDFLNEKEFTWGKLISKLIRNRKQFNSGYQQSNFYFWWRLADEMYRKGKKRQRRTAIKIQKYLISHYNTEIQFGAKIGKRFFIPHFIGLIIPYFAEIGDDFICCQGVTLGISKEPFLLKIGNNVFIGANSVVLCGEIEIGDNVTIGAMTLVAENIPANTKVFTERVNRMVTKTTDS